jgi:ATP-dependent NAD(P)H-hydrate dehydratase
MKELIKTAKGTTKNLGAFYQYQANHLRNQVRERVPSLQDPHVAEKRKGLDGRVGVIGGSREYTGAPYFAAVSAFKTGADLVHCFTHPDASSVIKGYCPELIVHPLLWASSHDQVEASALNIAKFFSRLDVLVIGCGLGRDDLQLSLVARIIELARLESIPMVLDADALSNPAKPISSPGLRKVHFDAKS